MKKYPVIALMAAALLAAACAKESLEEPVALPEGSTYTFTLTASQEDAPDTRTSYADDKYFSWSAGDQISVLFHSGDENRFFTLTTSGTGSSASFSGEIEAGFSLGSSDGDHSKIALYPAGAHTYDPSLAKPAVFNIPFQTDFTESHFSANLPMAAIGDEDNHFAFYHISGSYKVVFTEIDPSVTKVRLFVKNQNTYKLSGNYTLQDGMTRWWDEYASEGSRDQTVSYVTAVDGDHKATFYIPYGHKQEHFLPVFTLTDAVNGNTLKTVTAKSKEAFIGANGERKPLKTRMVVLPEIPAPGTGTAPGWRSRHGINWDMVETVIPGLTTTKYAGINSMKVTSDAANLYILLDVKKSFLLDNASYELSNLATLYVGDGSDSGTAFSSWWWPAVKYQTASTGWLKSGNDFLYTAVSGTVLDNIANIDGEHCYYEIAYPRSAIPALQNTEAYVGLTFNKRYVIGSTTYSDPTEDATLNTGNDPCAYAPATGSSGSMVRITLPDYSPDGASGLPVEMSFSEADGDVTNPERGFYKHFEYRFDGGSIPSTSISKYSFDETLVLTIFYLRDYADGTPLSDAVLNKIDAEFAAARAKGKKAIVRFAYTWLKETPHEPSKDQIFAHLDQLAPKFSKYEDVIYVVQAGFIGTYGEWYYVDSDFEFSTSGNSLTGNYANRIAVVDKMLGVIPESRQIALRTPFYKRYYLYPNSITTAVPAITSFGTSPNQRIGYFNDAFRGSSNDTGTFKSQLDYDQWYGQGEWLVCGGESAYAGKDYDGDGTTTVAEKQRWLNENSALVDPDNSIAALRQQHFSYLHNAPSNILMDYWAGSSDAGGSFDWGGENKLPEMKKALGYRLVLGSVRLTGSSLQAGAMVGYSISIQNKGCARVIYPRPFQLVLLHNGTPTVLVENLMDIRDLAPGAASIVLSGSFTLPQGIVSGDKIALWLPDNAEGLRGNASYSIHLANSGITWSGGYNILHTF